MTLLLDVNVLVAFAWPTHAHHTRARTWFARRQEGWATSPPTEMGFVRLSANPSVVDQPLSPAEAAEVMASLRSMDGHRFWADAVDAATVDWGSALSYRHVPDAHLMAIAEQHGGRVATLDRRLVERSAGAAVLVT